MTLRFNLDGFHNRVGRDWNFAGRGGLRANARNHAKKHGHAGVWWANDSFTLFYRGFDGKVRQKSWQHAVPH